MTAPAPVPMNAQPIPSDPGSLEALVARLDARLSVDDYGPQADYPSPADDSWTTGAVAPLPDLGLLAVDGADSATFLHNQLTNDIEHLADTEARWYGYCSPKGRLLSTFLGWRSAEGFRFTVSRGLAEPVRKRLSMFVLRAKAKVLDASGEEFLFGLIGDRARDALARLGLAAPAAMAVSRHDGLTAVGLSAVSLAADALPASDRWILQIPADRVDEVWAVLRTTLTPVSSSVWRRTEILSGIPRILPGTSEHFVPQMVNYELVGGVNFKKGCYPGQEVVARSQYLGKLKRRTFVAHLDGAPPPAGADVTLPGQAEPIGEVVLAAPDARGGTDLLFEARTDALAGGTPMVGGIALRIGRLPYEIPGG